MNTIQTRLREQDVRQESAPLNPQKFLQFYLQSNFPQTAAIASPEQKDRDVEEEHKKVDYKSAKPLSGTSYDSPGRY
jgi:hypothetical protein